MVQADVGPRNGVPGSASGPWTSLVTVLVTPGRALAAAAANQYLLVPYLIATLLAGVLLVATPKPPPATAAGVMASQQSAPGGVRVGGARVASPLPLGPGSQANMSGAELLRALSPVTTGAMALATPLWSGLWRTVLLLSLAGMAGQALGFRRTLGVVGYSLIPVWLGDALRGVLVLVWQDPAGGTKIRWTLDALLPGASGMAVKALAFADVFQIWHAVLLVVGFAVLTRRSAWQVAWVALLILALPPVIKHALPYLNRWFGPENAGTTVQVIEKGAPGGPAVPVGPGGPFGPGAFAPSPQTTIITVPKP